MNTYPLAPNPIFYTIQGEGLLFGTPMVFVRLGGCSVRCPECDTDYGIRHRMTANEIRKKVEEIRGKAQWIWVTGGEPADYDLRALLEELRLCGRVAVATSGHKSLGEAGRLVDFLSVSPHAKPTDLILKQGSQINLVPGLGGMRLEDWSDIDLSGFAAKWITPFWYDPSERMERVGHCLEFIRSNPDFRLGIQAHKFWGLD